MADTVASAPAVTRGRERTRARLLDAAAEVFAEVGMDAVSVEAICERAGFTRGAFYSNFASKEELFLALITQLAGAKMDQVAVRVRELTPTTIEDIPAAVRHVLGHSLGGDVEPQLISEMRTQALRDPRLGEAFLAWQAVMRARIAQIIAHVRDAYGLRVRMPVDDAAELLLDVSEDTCVRAALEGCSPAEANERLNARIAQLVALFVEPAQAS
ncbi:MAG: TetR family transcriptional regulator [Microbacterium sp.]